ncbi:hypothetical protein [Mycoavidus sp. B2-EB]|uniref:hypothetical protein n=1 Tax=Mycoavidus sp. B2-EB TaxID=2651972 RepID=UPI001624C532|nr:hypothetical protein [Mycoavidus sp. B2-EB]
MFDTPPVALQLGETTDALGRALEELAPTELIIIVYFPFYCISENYRFEQITGNSSRYTSFVSLRILAKGI